MNKVVLKIFVCFTLTAALIAIILLGINFLGFAFISSDSANIYESSPRKILDSTSQALILTEEGYRLEEKGTIPLSSWCILIGEDGNILWSENKPEDIPDYYSINDIAKMTKWFLNDYPVYVQTRQDGLLVLGNPKNTVGKYELEYSMDWFDSLPQRVLAIFFINLILAVLLAVALGASLYKRLKELTKGIQDLRAEQRVKLSEKGIFKELSRNMNETSSAIQRKNAALSARDNARVNWVAGISHDIRTPLAIAMGNAEVLENSRQLPEQSRKKAGVIKEQMMKVKKLIEDLNLISSLEHDMQPAQRKKIRLCPFLRRIAVDIINSGISEKYQIELDLKEEKTMICVDAFLLERAIFNLIHNSMLHNKNGCRILISTDTSSTAAFITIADNGSGVPQTVLEKIEEFPKTAHEPEMVHGLGLPLAYRIIAVHGGKMTAENKNGFVVTIELPKEG